MAILVKRIKVKRVERFDERTRAGRGLAGAGAKRILAMRWEIVGCEQRGSNGKLVRAGSQKKFQTKQGSESAPMERTRKELVVLEERSGVKAEMSGTAPWIETWGTRRNTAGQKRNCRGP